MESMVAHPHRFLCQFSNAWDVPSVSAMWNLLTFQVASNDYAFAMVNLASGLGACWGDSRFGGDCSALDFNGVTKAG